MATQTDFLPGHSSFLINQPHTTENKHFFQDWTFLAVLEEACKTSTAEPVQNLLLGLLGWAGDCERTSVQTVWRTALCKHHEGAVTAPFAPVACVN